MKRNLFKLTGALAITLALVFGLAGCDTGGGGSGGSFEGIWIGSDSYGQQMFLSIAGNEWECEGDSGISWKGTYTSSGGRGNMIVTQIKKSSSWGFASGSGNAVVSGNTLTATFIITSEGGASTTATFTRM